ncbi:MULTISPECIES: hypothetical protein [unclassified Thiomonas]|jgi:hypothetical protein|uniref:hypothetical protein n=1 Tax=unclassified Thiomonas TaxID=2625466 RepID=UPI000BDD99E8|nr:MULTISPECIES: hypothetical protein [unclassified Thiomonas]OZB72188.1 MAG: hypothetical protein B7X30_00960 [Thiomonas sp. 13-64-67]
MNNDTPEIDDSEIPDSAFTGPAPTREAKPEHKPTGNVPDGPACPEKCKDEQGRAVHTWRNTTRNGKAYFRCSHCKGCWWPDRDETSRIDPASKWPPLNK